MTDVRHPNLLFEPAAARRKLIVFGLNLRNLWSHEFNELLGYKSAASGLGLSHQIIVRRRTDPRLVAALSAEPITITENLELLWAAIEAHDLSDADIMLFTGGHLGLISNVGRWLAGRPPQRRPGVFFRVIGNEIIDLQTVQYNIAAPFFRTDCLNLRTQPGQERIFLLVENPQVARMVTRVSCRRTFLMPIPKYLPETINANDAEPAQPTVYIHLNKRSGDLIFNLGDIIHRVRTTVPTVKFVVKSSGLPRQARVVLESGIAPIAETLPAELSTADYLANFLKCTVVLLAYQPQIYRNNTSGVFVEAASFGKPVVVPKDTWMARQIKAGLGAGTIYENPTPESVAAALLEALTASASLSIAARSLAPQVRNANSSQRYIEQMMMLSRQMPDMDPRYQFGEEIDFSDSRDSRCFMRGGWGDTEGLGVWTVGPLAELNLRIGSEADKSLVLRAFLQPFLTQKHRRISVRVLTADGEIAQWKFNLDAPEGTVPRWCEASIPIREDNYRSSALEITFAIDSPASQLAMGVSDDPRTLGIYLRKLILHAAT